MAVTLSTESDSDVAAVVSLLPGTYQVSFDNYVLVRRVADARSLAGQKLLALFQLLIEDDEEGLGPCKALPFWDYGVEAWSAMPGSSASLWPEPSRSGRKELQVVDDAPGHVPRQKGEPAVEQDPYFGDAAYHAGLLALGLVAEGRRLLQRVEPLMEHSPERSRYLKDMESLN